MSDFIHDLYRSIAGPVEGFGEFVFDRDGIVRKVFHFSAPWLIKATTTMTPYGRMAGMGYAALAEVGITTAYAASWAEYLHEGKVFHNLPAALMYTSLAAEQLIAPMSKEELQREKEAIAAVAPWVPLEWPF